VNKGTITWSTALPLSLQQQGKLWQLWIKWHKILIKFTSLDLSILFSNKCFDKPKLNLAFSHSMDMVHWTQRSISAISLSHLSQPTRQTRRADRTSFIPISARTDLYKYSFFPRTLLDWNTLVCWSPSQVLVLCKWVSWSGRLSHDTPAVKGDAHCWIFAEELKKNSCGNYLKFFLPAVSLNQVNIIILWLTLSSCMAQIFLTLDFQHFLITNA